MSQSSKASASEGMGVELAHLMAALAALESAELPRVPSNSCRVETGGVRGILSERGEGSKEVEAEEQRGARFPKSPDPLLTPVTAHGP